MASSRDYEDPISARLENHISTGVSAPTGFEIQFKGVSISIFLTLQLWTFISPRIRNDCQPKLRFVRWLLSSLYIIDMDQHGFLYQN